MLLLTGRWQPKLKGMSADERAALVFCQYHPEGSTFATEGSKPPGVSQPGELGCRCRICALKLPGQKRGSRCGGTYGGAAAKEW